MPEKLTDEQMDDLDLSEEERAALADEDDDGKEGDAGDDDGAGGKGDDGQGDGGGSDDGAQDGGDQGDAGDKGKDDGAADDQGDGGDGDTPTGAINPDMLGVDVAAAKERLTAIDGEIATLTETRNAALKDLKEKYEEGYIDAEEYAEQRDAITSKVNDEKITLIEERAGLKSDVRFVEGLGRASYVQRWQADRDAFMAQNHAIKDDDVLYDAYSRQIEKIGATDEGRKMTNVQLLEAAKKKIAHLLPKDDPGETAEQKRARLIREAREAQALKDKGKAAKMKTLRGAPSADHDQDDSKFARLDALEGEALEEALATLTPDEAERYLAGQ